MRHVIVMTAASSVGLMAIFAVDLLSLLWVSRLGDPKLTAAVGFATQVLFFSVSISIGLSIAIGAVVSRALGAGDRAAARRLAASGLVHVFLIAAAASCAAWPFRREILTLFGARDMTLDVASSLSRDHAARHGSARSRHGAREHIARGRRRQARDVCDARGSHRHRHSRSAVYFRPRPWRHWRGHRHHDFTVRCRGRWT